MIGRREISVVMPNLQHPIVIRPRSTDRFVFEQIFLDSDYELTVDLSPHFIVDAGANVGFASIYFANRYPGATIIALEPEPKGTRLTYTEQGVHFDGLDSVEGREEGTRGLLEQLASHLTSGR